eukprot:5606027-Prymnesium_polylepis.1
MEPLVDTSCSASDMSTASTVLGDREAGDSRQTGRGTGRVSGKSRRKQGKREEATSDGLKQGGGCHTRASPVGPCTTTRGDCTVRNMWIQPCGPDERRAPRQRGRRGRPDVHEAVSRLQSRGPVAQQRSRAATTGPAVPTASRSAAATGATAGADPSSSTTARGDPPGGRSY